MAEEIRWVHLLRKRHWMGVRSFFPFQFNLSSHRTQQAMDGVRANKCSVCVCVCVLRGVRASSNMRAYQTHILEIGDSGGGRGTADWGASVTTYIIWLIWMESKLALVCLLRSDDDGNGGGGGTHAYIGNGTIRRGRAEESSGCGMGIMVAV